MTAAVGAARDTELVALARAKLATVSPRNAELDRLTGLLHQGERVVTLCDALCRTGRQERRGLTVLTDQRLICIYTGSSSGPLTQFPLSAISSVEVGVPRGAGDSKRGELAMRSDDVETQLARIHPWERAEEIGQSIEDAISARESIT